MTIRLVFTLMLSFVVLGVHADVTEEKITFCMDANNAPFSSRDGQINLNSDIVKSVADKLQRPLQVQLVDVPMRGGLPRAIKQAFKGELCDAFLGVPADKGISADLKEDNITTTVPYLSVGYLAISTKAPDIKVHSATLNDLRFGASSATPADLFLLHNDLNRIAFGSNLILLDALKRKHIDAALIWSPSIVKNHEDWVVHKALIEDLTFVDPLVWQVSMAIKDDKHALLDELNEAITALKGDGTLEKLTEGKDLTQF